MHRYTHTKNAAVLSHTHETQLHVSPTRVHRLLVTNNVQSSFPSADTCQGQLQNCQSVSVLLLLPLP